MKRFTRVAEDFVCENCGKQISGNGYTNHCPFCLYSKHVDHNPGDRSHKCRGLMKPSSVESKSGEYVIVHRCIKCGATKRNKFCAGDSFDALIAIVQKGA